MARLKDIEEEYEGDDQTITKSEEGMFQLDTSNIENALSLSTKVNQGGNINTEVKNSMKESLNEMFNEQGVEIIDVVLHNVIVSEESKSKLIEETKVIASLREEKMQKLSDLLRAIQEEETVKLGQFLEEEKTALLKDGEYDEIVQNMELVYQNAKSQDLIEKIEAQTYTDVRQIEADNDFTVQKLIDLARLDARNIVEEAKAESAIANEEAKGEASIIEALADMESAYFEAKGQKGKENALFFFFSKLNHFPHHPVIPTVISALVNADILATPMMRKIYQYQSKMLKIKVHESLAENNRLVITGTSGGSTANKILMADAALLNVQSSSIDNPSRNKIMEELKILRQSSSQQS